MHSGQREERRDNLRDGEDRQSQVATFCTSYFVFSLFQILIGQLQVKVELSLLLLEIGKLGDKLARFLQSAKRYIDGQDQRSFASE